MLLLAAAVFINYFDRGNLATTAPLLQRELGLSSTQMGVLFSAFFWAYAPLQPVAGYLAQRYDIRIVLGSGLALWAAATMLSGFAAGFWSLLGLRMLVGLGESISYPCNAKFLSQHAPVHERGRANGFIAVGQALGPTCGTLIAGFVMARYGWRPTFVLFGMLSLLWLWPWLRATSNGETRSSVMQKDVIPYRLLLRERSVWGTSLGHFCGNYAFYFALSWLPSYLVNVEHQSAQRMAITGAAVYACQAVSAPATGWFCDWLILRGHPASLVLKSAINLGLAGVALSMVICGYVHGDTAVGWLLFAGVCFGVQSAPLGSITQTLGGPRAAAQWMGVQNLIANLAGVLAPVITGFIVDRSGHFVLAFLLAGGITLVGILGMGVVVRRVRPLEWSAA